MPRETLSVEIDAPGDAVFEIIHNYDCRLEWDTMLREARLLGGASAAAAGVRSVCVGTWRSLFLALETEYVRFEPGRVAAVKLTNQPPFFEHFAATIRHEAIGEGRSRTTYIYFFRTRPRFLAPLLEPIMNMLLKREVRQRLYSLRRYLAGQRVQRENHDFHC
ncbi:MAG: SRPBCC family protein [Anaerolineae bacterium]|nr:SRPBCC family protein [Anaerolineae bacterium]